MSIYVRSEADAEQVEKWTFDCNIHYLRGNVIINAKTFNPVFSYELKSESDIIFTKMG